jgi:hypothetical protein
MLVVPIHLGMAVTGAQSPCVRVFAGLHTRQPEALGERLRHQHTHGAPPGGVPIGHAGERGGSTWPHDGGPVVRGTSSSGHQAMVADGYAMRIAAQVGPGVAKVKILDK